MKCLSLPLTLIVLAGCQSDQTVMLAPNRGGQMVSAGKNLLGRAAPIGAADNLRESETVKVYGVNRYTDAADSDRKSVV